MSVDDVSGKTGKWSSSELRDAKVRVVFAKIFYSMMGSQKRIGKKLKGEGNLDSDVKVRRCGLGDGPKRCCRGEMEEKKGNSSPEPPLPKNTHAQGVAECADQGSAFTVTRGYINRDDLPADPWTQGTCHCHHHFTGYIR